MVMSGDNKYRVTFFTPAGIEQKTILHGKSLPHLMDKVHGIMNDPHGYFIDDQKNNSYFQVKENNVSYITYELLFSGKSMTIEKIKNLSGEVISELFKTVKDAEIYAMAFYDMDIDTRDFLLAKMDSDFRTRVEKEIGLQKQLASADIFYAQEMLIDKLVGILED